VTVQLGRPRRRRTGNSNVLSCARTGRVKVGWKRGQGSGERQEASCAGQPSQGVDAVYNWGTMRAAGENWATFVARCTDDELPTERTGRTLYNLTFVSEKENRELRDGAI